MVNRTVEMYLRENILRRTGPALAVMDVSTSLELASELPKNNTDTPKLKGLNEQTNTVNGIYIQ